MLRTILLYGALLAAGSLGLQWLQYQYLVRAHPAEAWLVQREPARPFEANTRAVESLGISARELEVLTLLAAGQSNKQIASRLEVSPNTVKTHVAKLFEKLAVRRRTEAILRARELGMIR